MLLTCKEKFKIQKLKGVQKSKFDMKDLGKAKKTLGMENVKDRTKDKQLLSRKCYLEKVFIRFSMENSKAVGVCLASHFKLSMLWCPEIEEKKQEMEKVPYANAIGTLMYAMMCSYPNIAQAINVLSRFMMDLGREFWDEVKQLLKYIRGTLGVGFNFGLNDDKVNIIGYIDSDYVDNLDNRRSTIGYISTMLVVLSIEKHNGNLQQLCHQKSRLYKSYKSSKKSFMA